MSNAILSAEDYLSIPRGENWLIKSLLPAGGAMLLYGDPKVGKSYAAIQLALALSGAQDDWFGFPVVRPGPVVYVQLDTPASLWAERLTDLRTAGHPIDLLYLADRETLKTWPFDILRPDHEQLLTESLRPLKPSAVIIDTLKESNSAEENSNTEMQVVIAKLTAATQPAALILVAHAKKPAQDSQPDLTNDNRGAGYVVGKMDAIVRFSKKGIYYTGRAIEEGAIKLDRSDDGFWEPSQAEAALEESIRSVLEDPTLTSLRERSRVLSCYTGRSEEACRSILRRRGAGN